MRQYVKQIPIPMSGLMLALFSITKLAWIFEQHLISKLFFGLAVLTWLLLVAKLIFAWSSVKQDLQNPVIASVAPTFTMGTMVFASMLAPFNMLAAILWAVAFLLQLVLIGYFIKQFIWKKQLVLTAVLPSWFIVFVGLGIVPITADAVFPMASHVIFYGVFMSYLVLLPVVIVRLSQVKLAEAVRPLLVIIAAPGSLCFVAYMQIAEPINSQFVIVLFVLSQVLYVIAVSKLPELVALPFYPSFAALTFPLVISATAAARMAEFTGNVALRMLANMEFIVAILIVLYVVGGYTLFFKRIRAAEVLAHSFR